MGTPKQLSLFFILLFTAFGLSSFASKNLIVKISENNFLTEKQIKVVITKNTTEEELEKIKKQMVDEGLQFNYANVDYNQNNEIISITIQYKDANNNSGNYSVSSQNPINDIVIVSEGSRIFVTSAGSSNQTFISQGSGEQTSKSSENSYEDRRQYMQEKSDQMEKEMQERMDAMKERQAEMRNRMQQRRDSISTQKQHPIKSAANFNGNTHIITKNSTDSELAQLQKTYEAEKISFYYNDLKRNGNNEITHISITIDNQNGSVSTSGFGNGQEAIKNISIAVDKQNTIIKNAE
ncbi:hypothetical protein AEQU2_02401 [Aequorivita lipolytica]|nr:hypothetical protein AEQU2_02401 [Aequorivita lipolytica]